MACLINQLAIAFLKILLISIYLKKLYLMGIGRHPSLFIMTFSEAS